MIRFIKWFFSNTKEPINDYHMNTFEKLIELQEKYNALLMDVKRLEDENIETTNTLYEIMNTIDAVDARIDILTAEKWVTNKEDDT